MSKLCKKCDRQLSVTKFHKDKTNKDGLNRWCNNCKRESRFKNCEIPEVYLKRRWVNFLKYTRRERVITYEELLDLFRQHCKENVIQGKHKYACAYTGDTMTFFQGRGQVLSNLSVDRIDNDQPYTKENIAFCSMDFNNKKGQLTLDIIKKILTFFKKKGINYEME